MMAEEAPPSLHPVAPSEVSKGGEIAQAKDATVPVVVLGATIGGLAAAVAIRSRTGRAVCVIDIDRKENEAERDREEEMFCVLSARSLDAVRAINADLHKALLASIAEEAEADPAVCMFDLPLRLSASHLREILVEHLTTGPGGASFVWRSSPLKHIKMLSQDDEEKSQAPHSAVILFENGTIVKAGLVVVATEKFPFLAQMEDP